MGAGEQDAQNYGNPAAWVRCRLMATTTIQTNAEETGQTAAESWYQFTQSLPSGSDMWSGLKTIVMWGIVGLIAYGLITRPTR